VVLDKSSEVLNWLDEDEPANSEDYKKCHKDLAKICDPILEKMFKPPNKPLKKGFLSNEKTAQNDINGSASNEEAAKEDETVAIYPDKKDDANMDME